MPPKHLFVSAVADGADATLVQPSDWNDFHVAPFATGTFTVPTEHGAHQVDLLNLTNTFVVTLAGTAVMVID